MEQIVNHFNTLLLTLIAARNDETKEMHKNLFQVEEREKAAREEPETLSYQPILMLKYI
jgi:hypothetical protein